MPNRIKAPGVFIEEAPTAAHPITGVATSIAAFIGRAARGPVDEAGPLFIGSYTDFERSFGKPGPACPMGQAVRDFFGNGGGQAVVVRLYKAVDGKPARARINIPGLPLEAASPGNSGNALRARIDNHVSVDAANELGLDIADVFNLTLYDAGTGTSETFANVSVRESPRRVDRVLAADSALARVAASLAFQDAIMPPAHQDPPAGMAAWGDDAFSTGVAAADRAGDSAPLDDAVYLGDADAGTGLHALERADSFNLVCIPPDTQGGDTSAAVYRAALTVCVTRRALLIVDAPAAWANVSDVTANGNAALAELDFDGESARNAALYFPRIVQSDPARPRESGTFVACGAIAGIMARTDSQRGVWKAPAGVDAVLADVQGLAANLDDADADTLNRLGINCLRNVPPAGFVVWGARTLRGADGMVDDYKYVPVRRLAMYIEESLERGLQWAAFEANDDSLWAQIRLSAGTFLHGLFLQGAFQGRLPQEGYFVKCDGGTTTQGDIDRGIVNIVVGFAPLKPAEFVILRLQQVVGRTPP
jgi:phage tail sheath protein FI